MIMIRIAFIWLALMLAKPVMAETAQQRWIGDVPIMDSMTIESDLGFAFDSPDGRIVVIYVSGMSNQSHLQDYYDMALIPWDGLCRQSWNGNGKASGWSLHRQRWVMKFGKLPSCQNKYHDIYRCMANFINP